MNQTPEAERSTALTRRIIVVMTVMVWIAVIAITAWRGISPRQPEMPAPAPSTVAALEAAAAADTVKAVKPPRVSDKKPRPANPEPSSRKSSPSSTPSSPLDNPIPITK